MKLIDITNLSDESIKVIKEDIQTLVINCFNDNVVDKELLNYYIDIICSLCIRENTEELNTYLSELMYEFSNMLEDSDEIYSTYMELCELKRENK